MNYPITDRATEDERLVAQSRLFDPITLRLLVEAGLAPGMRVLDLAAARATSPASPPNWSGGTAPWWDGSSSCTYRTPWPPYARPHHEYDLAAFSACTSAT